MVAATTPALSAPDPTNPPAYGQSVTFTATVSATNSGFGTPSGTVDFYDESTETDLGLGTYANGVYTLQTSSLDVEDHYITATYTPDTNSIFITGASDEFDQTVNQAATTTQVTVFDNTQGVSTTSPTYGDSLTFTATIGSAVSPAIGAPTGGVEFYDGSTDLGAGTAGDSGQWSMTTTAPLALGSHTILAVYSGDDSFSSSASTDPNGSSASVNVVGQTLSIDSLYLVGGGTVCQGSVATLKGTVSGLDGAAFSVTVVWGDGQTSDSDNGGQPFYCAAGTTTFLVTHYYAVPGDFTLDVTATAADGRQVEDNSSVSLNVTPAAPSVILDPPPVPEGGFAQHPDSEYTVSAEAFSADPASLTYEWTLEGTTVLSTGSSSVTVTGAEYDDVWLTVGSSGGATTVTLCDPTQTIGVVEGLPAAPTLTITESDANQMVFEGDVATFDVHATWAAWTMSPLGTASQGWWVSSALPNVYYSTMDASGAAPADYVSTRGPWPVAFGNVTYDSATGMYSADGTITVQTNGGIDDGGQGSVTVQLTHPSLGVVDPNGGGSATATIQHPELRLYLTDNEYSSVDVTNNGQMPINVEAGETVTLVAAVGNTWVPVTWDLPGAGEVVLGYNPYAATNQLTPVGQPGVGADAGSQVVSSAADTTFEWVGGGTFRVTATIAGTNGVKTTVAALFTVLAPDVTATATMEPERDPSDGHIVAHGSYLQKWGGLGLISVVPLVFNASAPAGWNYCFVQTVTTFAAFTAPSPPPGGESSGVTVFAPYSGLDKQFPYRTKDDKSQDGVFSPSPDGTQTYDTPRTPVYQEGASFRYLVATMYYMCEPVVDGQVVGGWVPLASITWSYVMAATWPPGKDPMNVWLSLPSISGQNPTYDQAYAFQQSVNQPTIEFATWSQTVPSPGNKITL